MPDQFVFDQNLGRFRPTSAAFEDCPDGDPMSSFWAELHLSKGLKPEDCLYKHDGFYLAAIGVGFVRSLKQKIHLDPIEGKEDPRENQPAHVLVVGLKPSKSFGRAVAKACSWQIAPTKQLGSQVPE
ncbi:MAG: hypothetical protein K2X77_13190 [Candidatus Obscuribacterales bacterium]|nr:hypothetical protein [Candidatus Obscuribacterales bacterium]